MSPPNHLASDRSLGPLSKRVPDLFLWSDGRASRRRRSALQQLRKLLGTAVTLAVACSFAFGSRADHDGIPVPPPNFTAQKLQSIPNPVPNAITVSGLSSGAFFAHQFHLAYSKLVIGAGLIAGGPYGCVENIPNPYFWFWTVPLDRLSAALVACTHYLGDRYFGLRPSAPKAEDSLRFVREAWSRRVIDDPAYLRDDRVWLFRGRRDEIVPSNAAAALKQVYEALGVRQPQLHVNFNENGRVANHGMPVTRFTGQSGFQVPQCAQHEPPFIIECEFEAAEGLLRHLYAENFQPASDDPHRDGTLIVFDQFEFFDRSDPSVGLHGVGYAYVPMRCAEARCRLHVAFHGCKQDLDSIHDDFVRDAGYNRWAATNNIVVLYPQATSSASNPNRCWDFWGYTGSDYYGQTGKQMRAVKAMVDRALGTQP